MRVQSHEKNDTRARGVTRQFLALGAWLAISFAAAAVGAAASVDSADFYRTLQRPAWAPPSSWFGPVWSVLYFLMGLAAWLVWRTAGFQRACGPLTLFLVQLAFNALWTWLFFAWRQGALAFAEILLLWILILGTLIGFWRIRPLAGALMVPYLVWVTYAAALTYAIWQGNAGLAG